MASTNKSGSEPEPETSVVPGPTQNVSPSDTSFKSGLAQMKQRLRDLGIPDATQDKMEAEVPGSVKKIYDSMQAKPNPLSPPTSTRKERADALARAMGTTDESHGRHLVTVSYVRNPNVSIAALVPRRIAPRPPN